MDDQDNLSADDQRFMQQVQAVDAAAGPAPGEPGGPELEPEPQGDPAEENTAILTCLVTMLAPVLPFLPACYTPERIRQIATAYTAVEQKHGWNLRDLMSVEAQLLIVAAPPTIQAILYGRAHFAEMRRRAAEKDITPRTPQQEAAAAES